MRYNEIIYNWVLSVVVIVVVVVVVVAAAAAAETAFPRCSTDKCLKTELGLWSKLPWFKSRLH